MRTTEPALGIAPPDARLLKLLALVNGAVPLALLALDAWRGRLGVNGVNFAIRTTGILGLTFLLLSLAITPLRRLTGWGAAVAARRRVGVYAFVYVALHFAIFFAFDRAGSVRSTVREVVTRRYLQVGTLGLLILLALAVTSTDGMVSRLGARRWKRLHRLTYAAGVAGVVHYVLLVKSDLRQPLAFAAALAALLGYRVVRHYLDLRAAAAAPRVAAAPAPARGFWTGALRVSRVFNETPDVRTFRLTAPGGGRLPFESTPGQYLNVALPIGGGRVRRSYTIASSPTRADYCEITVKRVRDGHASHHLHDAVREGDLLQVSAPAGRFVFTGEGATQVVLLAGGVGITPLMAIVRALTDRCWAGQIHLVFSAQRESDVIFREELDYLARRFPNLHVVVTLTREPAASDWTGRRGAITADLLRDEVPTLAAGPVFICGPDAMMAAMRALVAERGVDASNVHTEAFASPPATAATRSEPEAAPAPAAPEALVSIRFVASRRSVEVPSGRTVLEAAEEAGIALPFECRSGICGQCKTRLVDGQVVMETQDALTAADREKGLILACQARAASGAAVDA
ncbi:MAG: 2Fe-2S iron-sulfur cluster-binding protein [Polyangiales bacterium]